jgi:hypothetical protein
MENNMQDPNYDAIVDFKIHNSIKEVLYEKEMTLEDWFFHQITIDNHRAVIQLVERKKINPEIVASNGYSALKIAEIYSKNSFDYLKNTIDSINVKR